MPRNNQSPFLKYNDFTKSFDFSPWGGIEGFLEASKAGMTGYNNKGSQYRVMVPDVFRAVDMTGVAVSSLPFDILKGKTVVDTSADWQNVLGGMPNPQRLIYNVASSLCGGAAYVIPEGTGDVTGNLKYVPPGTVDYSFDTTGINRYNYTSQFGGVETFEPDEIIHFFLPDSDMEEQPAKAHPLGVAMSAAYRSLAMNNTINVQSDRGFIPPTLLMAEGMPIGAEREKAEAWWNLWIKGAFRTIAKIVNAKSIKVEKVGAGMDELKAVFVELKRDASEEIYKAFGIPAALAMSDKAFASEYDALVIQWYSASVFVTIYQTIQETLTEQWLSKTGHVMKFKPESIDVFQEDENAKAQSFKVYVDAGIRPSLAAKILGIDMPDGTEPEDLDEEFDKPEPVPVVVPNGSQPTKEPETKPLRAIVLSPDEMKDLALWYDKARAWFVKGKSAVDWENKHLRESIASQIRFKLAAAQSEAEIIKAFELTDVEEEEKKPDSVLLLAEAIENAAKMNLLKAPAAPNFSVTMPPISMTAHMPEQREPSVTFSPVIQPSDVSVQVTNEVQPAPVEVKSENNITVQPADVNIPKPVRETQKVKRDRQNLIESTDTKIEYEE